MSLFAIAWKSIRQRLLVSSLTSFSVALAVALMVTVLVIHGVVSQMFNQNATGYDLVVGAKGSSLQLVLNTIFFVDKPIENIPYKYYKQLAALKSVEMAVPIALGDSTADGRYRIVGTTTDYFGIEYIPGRRFHMASGAMFGKAFEAVIGAKVARTYGWKVGSEFPIAHGGNTEDIHKEIFKVVGVLSATGTPADRAVFVHLDGFYQMAGHDKPLDEALEKERQAAGGEQEIGKRPAAVPVADRVAPKPGELPDEQKEVTAVLLRFRKGMMTAIRMMEGQINDGLTAQAVSPLRQILWLMRNVVGNIQTALMALTFFILLVSGIGIFVSIYNSLAERRREIAILRALGANRMTIFAIILCEATLLCLIGGVAGIVLGHGLVVVAAPIIEARSDLLLNPWSFETAELALFPLLLAIAGCVGMAAGTAAYRTDVARGLQG